MDELFPLVHADLYTTQPRISSQYDIRTSTPLEQQWELAGLPGQSEKNREGANTQRKTRPKPAKEETNGYIEAEALVKAASGKQQATIIVLMRKMGKKNPL